MIKNILKNYYHKISLKRKLMIIAIISMFYPIVILGYFGYKNYTNEMINKSINSSKKSAEELCLLISDRIKKLTLYSIQILYDNQIYTLNKKLNNNDHIFEYSFRKEFEDYLKSVLFSKDSLNAVAFRFTKNKKIFISNRDYTDNVNIMNDMDNICNKAKLGKGKPMWYISEKDNNILDMYICKTVYDTHTLDEIGVLSFKINKDSFFDVFNSFNSNNEKNFILYSANNIELLKHTSFDDNHEEWLKKHIQQDFNKDITKIKINNDNVYLISKTIEPINWNLIVTISSNILLKEVKHMLQFTIFLCIITLPIWLILINFVYKDLIKPMSLLIKNMHDIENGDMGVTIEIERSDELGYLFKSFNKMSTKITNLINKVYKEDLALKDAELKALQAQINPHFLFNTLEAINWKAKIHGVDEISDMISSFSVIIEANLNRNNEKIITIDKEIDYMNNYIFLIKKRFGTKVSFSMDIDENTQNCIVPKLILQPIIENAIYHGIETKKGKGIIDLKIYKSIPFLIIQVKDNGIGIKKDKLLDLNNQLTSSINVENAKETKSKSNIGMINVHRRIRLLYGDCYGLSIESNYNIGTTLTIKLPIIDNKGDELYDKSSYNR